MFIYTIPSYWNAVIFILCHHILCRVFAVVDKLHVDGISRSCHSNQNIDNKKDDNIVNADTKSDTVTRIGGVTQSTTTTVLKNQFVEINPNDSFELELKNVEFSYKCRPDQLVLKGMNASFKKGEGIIAICGKSGSGKSTLLGVMAGLYSNQNMDVDNSITFNVSSEKKIANSMADDRLELKDIKQYAKVGLLFLFDLKLLFNIIFCIQICKMLFVMLE